LYVRQAFETLKAQGNTNYRIYASHYDLQGQSPCDIDNAHCVAYCKKDDLPPHIDLAVGTRVKVTYNAATQIGLYNGAMGTVHSFGYVDEPPDQGTHQISLNSEIPVVFVQMDLDTRCTIDSSSVIGKVPIANLIPFCAIASDTKIKNKYIRWQLPLRPAHARTVHSAQGMTAIHGAILYPNALGAKHFARALEYVMTSRPTTNDDIYLMTPLTIDHFNYYDYQRACIRNEYSRLRKRFLHAD